MLIAKQAGITIIRNSVAHLLKSNERGISILKENKWFIIYDDTQPLAISRFTIAHELGHIFLGHSVIKGYLFRTFAKERPDIESEADMFAARLLAPACVLHELGITTADDIAKICNISITAAKNRAERMAILEKRNAWYLHPLEQQVYKQFESFINDYHKK